MRALSGLDCFSLVAKIQNGRVKYKKKKPENHRNKTQTPNVIMENILIECNRP